MRSTLKKPLALLATLATAGIVLTACGSSAPTGPQTLTIDKASNGKSVTAHVGDTVNASLAANPSTGYIWIPISGTGLGAPLIQTGSSFVPDSKSKPNGQGMQTLHFHVSSAGTVPVVLEYTMPLHQGTAKQRVTVTINATAAK